MCDDVLLYTISHIYDNSYIRIVVYTITLIWLAFTLWAPISPGEAAQRPGNFSKTGVTRLLQIAALSTASRVVLGALCLARCAWLLIIRYVALNN